MKLRVTDAQLVEEWRWGGKRHEPTRGPFAGISHERNVRGSLCSEASSSGSA
jgi:hypothetical protein